MAQRPNVLFIAVDDLVPNLGCYGDTTALTPQIDSLASQGMAFLNHHCQWAVCGPSRASMTTSLMPEETNVIGFRPIRAVLPDVITLPQHFKNQGYETVGTGKFYDPRTVGTITDPNGSTAQDTDDLPSWSLPYVEVNSGFNPAGKPAVDDTDQADSLYVDHKILTEGLGLIDTLAAGNKPFFLAVGFKKPHLPFVAPKRFWDLYDRNSMPLAAYTGLPVGATTYNQNTLTDNDELLGYAPYDTSGLPSEAQQRELIHGYYACVSMIDEFVGQLRTKLAATPDPVQTGMTLADTTIIVLWGDHGFHLGDHGKWAKHTAMERGSKCPLIIFDPRNPTAPGANSTNSPANSMDIYPTLCELAGLPIPEQPLSDTVLTGRPLRGRSLVPVMEDPESSVHFGAVTQFQINGQHGYAYRTERFRLIEWVNSSSNITGRDLYDYQLDPLETKNLADDPSYAAIVHQLSRSLRAETTIHGAGRLESSSAIATGGDAFLPFVSIHHDGADVILDWPSSGGVSYDILANETLAPGPWAADFSDVPASPVSFARTTPRRFFRVGFGENTPPRFNSDPVRLPDVAFDEPVTGTLAGHVADPDAGDTISFTAIDAPSWLSVASDGTLSGTPTSAEEGAWWITVEASDAAGSTARAKVQISVVDSTPPPAPEILQSWAFNDAANTGLKDLVNTGTAGDAFDFNAADEIETDGLGRLIIGDDPGANAVTTGITKDWFRGATFAGGELTAGVYETEFRIEEWQLTTAAGNGFEVTMMDADGTSLKTIFNSTTGAADTRIRVVDNGTGGSSGQNAGYGTTSATGMTVRTTVDLDAGQWQVDYLPDGGSTWLPAVSAMPLSTDFTGISTLRIAVEGDPTPWAAGDFVAVDSLKFTKLP
ncbi:MAG: sulfatase-like hydrolase/transferase [Akkermansiaceae bacterium]|nr:sulfatase-like hydrolase/transferase [Akkermansiaceae bacterium]